MRLGYLPEGEDDALWKITAYSDPFAMPRWLVTFQHSTPTEIVAAINTAITDPAPVIRYGYDLRRLPPQATATPVKPPVPTPLDVRRAQAASARTTLAPPRAVTRPFIPAPRRPTAPQVPRPGHSR